MLEFSLILIGFTLGYIVFDKKFKKLTRKVDGHLTGLYSSLDSYGRDIKGLHNLNYELTEQNKRIEHQIKVFDIKLEQLTSDHISTKHGKIKRFGVKK